MSLRPDDTVLIRQLEEVFVSELDRQYLDGEIEETTTGEVYFDAVDGELSGRPDWYKAVTKVMEAYWAEEGR
ncbi:Uncharacterised protein [Mycobacteroides abscessus subsp. abscessus]|uniref:Uncharacterized protein n=1 Tax=Mycobacteroides abscessus subsp. abscessus TaxID=1185650 RepID=A0AB38D0D0_9MYCO|nr:MULTISPECIES: hypothetical protein [Mycobacteroides]OHT91328.1 hypothetical protein BKG70_00930 [Mycobacteroides chelonae]SHX05825.1 Uncharacterised protein [Mycobacteroides abscessus subsp. abscessus]SIA12757.1 Uncharacterised protein [Mycobacteroides abscessus subsp. abscessus]SIB13859.1 Uncharacterised protein [Mycobacteroides abscessus subsp. abscessus]SIB14935.1 Uncharacterised protein [Mycobacteroides abscessus subsp. abscessus]